MDIDVSIVIVCMNRMDNLYPCLQSIRENTKVSYETFVVAYLFDPANLERAKADFPWVTFIESSELRGFAENNNLALRQARGRYTFVLNDDTEFSMPLIDTLMADFRKVPSRTAIISPRLVNADGSLQLCGRPPYPAYKYVLQQWHMYKEPIDNGKGLFRTYNITGACFLIRTDVFRELGWFDERYYFTPEDIALSTLAREKGYEVWCDANAVVTHKWRTTASRISPAVRPCAIKGSLIFFSRGNILRYLLLGAGVWAAEKVKCIKAYLSRRELDYQTYKHNVECIFTRQTPKEIFVKYYTELLVEETQNRS